MCWYDLKKKKKCSSILFTLLDENFQSEVYNRLCKRSIHFCYHVCILRKLIENGIEKKIFSKLVWYRFNMRTVLITKKFNGLKLKYVGLKPVWDPNRPDSLLNRRTQTRTIMREDKTFMQPIPCCGSTVTWLGRFHISFAQVFVGNDNLCHRKMS